MCDRRLRGGSRAGLEQWSAGGGAIAGATRELLCDGSIFPNIEKLVQAGGSRQASETSYDTTVEAREILNTLEESAR